MCDLPSQLFKFRSLTSDQEFCWAKEILETGKFYCSKFYKQNDPMEGVFTFDPHLLMKWDHSKHAGNKQGYKLKEALKKIFDQKQSYSICSFSSKAGFSNPALWGHYASGFQGIAFEIANVPNNMYKVKYVRSARTLLSRTPSSIVKILTTKLNQWKHESEYRYLTKEGEGLQSIGTIKAVYFGNPYGNTVNRTDPYNVNEKFQKFFELRSALFDVANGRRIPCYLVQIDGSVVVKGKEFNHGLYTSHQTPNCDEQNNPTP
jgi:hypothetical protein